jgi:putative MATE family efflux protein
MSTKAAKPTAPGMKAVFTEGSTMRHVIIMTLTSAIGLMAIFFVDVITLFYISQLNDAAQTAAVGRASYVLGFVIGMSVGFMIGASAMVARSIGAGDEDAARSYAGTSLISAFAFGAIVTLCGFLLTNWLMGLLKAEGDALQYARIYLYIVLPTMPFLSVGMVTMGLLRAKGDAKRSMVMPLIGGAMTALLDPFFIFVLGWEVVGAAIVSSLMRVTFAALGLYFVIKTHNMVALPTFERFKKDLANILKIALPTVATNLAAPVGAFLIAQAVADFGDAAIAGQSVVDRLVPLAFGVIFSLSGAVGPIIGQNYGAVKMARVRQALIDALIFNGVYVCIAWAALFAAQSYVVYAFNASGDMEVVIRLFCTVMASSFLFNGMLFVSNAAFNNLGKPIYATAFNWARQTIGVVPFVYLGAEWAGLDGIYWGITAGAVIFGIIPVVAAFALIQKLTNEQVSAEAQAQPAQ